MSHTKNKASQKNKKQDYVRLDRLEELRRDEFIQLLNTRWEEQLPSSAVVDENTGSANETATTTTATTDVQTPEDKYAPLQYYHPESGEGVVELSLRFRVKPDILFELNQWLSESGGVITGNQTLVLPSYADGVPEYKGEIPMQNISNVSQDSGAHENIQGTETGFYEQATNESGGAKIPQTNAPVPITEPVVSSWPYIELPPLKDRGDIKWNTKLTKAIKDKYHWDEVMERFLMVNPLGKEGMSQSTLDQWVLKNLSLGWTSDMDAPCIFDVILLPDQEYNGKTYPAIEAFSGDDAFAAATTKLHLTPNVGQGFLWIHKNSGKPEYSGYGFSVHSDEGVKNYSLNKANPKAVNFADLGKYSGDQLHSGKVEQLTTFKAQMYSDDFYELVCSMQRILMVQDGSAIKNVTGIYDATTASEFGTYVINNKNPKPKIVGEQVEGVASSKDDPRTVLISKLYYICGDLALYQSAMKEEDDLNKKYSGVKPVMLTDGPEIVKLYKAASNVLFWNAFYKPIPPDIAFYTAVDQWGATFKGDEQQMDLARVSRLAQIEYDSHAKERKDLVDEQKKLQDAYNNSTNSQEQLSLDFSLRGNWASQNAISMSAFYPKYDKYQTYSTAAYYKSTVPYGQEPNWDPSQFPLLNPFDPKGENQRKPWEISNNIPSMPSVQLTSQDNFMTSVKQSQQNYADLAAQGSQTLAGNYDNLETALVSRRTKIGLELNKRAGEGGDSVVTMWAQIQRIAGYYNLLYPDSTQGLRINGIQLTVAQDKTAVYNQNKILEGNTKAVSNISNELKNYKPHDPATVSDQLFMAMQPFFAYMVGTTFAQKLPARYANETKNFYSVDDLVAIVNELYDLYTFQQFPQEDLLPQTMSDLEESARRMKETKKEFGDMHVLPCRFLLKQSAKEVSDADLSGERKNATTKGIALPAYWSKTGDSYKLVIDLGDKYVTKYYYPPEIFNANNPPKIQLPTFGKSTPGGGDPAEDSKAINSLVGKLDGYDLPEGTLTYITPDGNQYDAEFEKPWDVASVLGMLALVVLAVAVPFALAIEGALVGSTIMATAGAASTTLFLGSIAAGLAQKEAAGTATGWDYALAGLNALTALLPVLKLTPGALGAIEGATGELAILNGKTFGVIMAGGAVINGFVMLPQFIEQYDVISNMPDGPAKNAAMRDLMLSGLLTYTLLFMQFKMGVEAYQAGTNGAYVDPSVTVSRVQGGTGTNQSVQRILLDASGNVTIEGDNMLYVTINDIDHSVYFYNKRGGANAGAEIVTFEVPQSLLDEIESSAVSQAESKSNPNSPQVSDPTKSSGAYGLPKVWIDKLQNAAIPGSGKIIKP